jgi:hypothetical protein
MIDSAQKKLASVIDGTSQFLLSLNDDIQRMNRTIDTITQSGQKFIDSQINKRFDSFSLSQSNYHQNKIEDVQAEEVK